MKFIKYISLLIIPILFVACHDEPDWLGDNTTTEGRHFPVTTAFSVIGESIVDSDTTVQFDFRYWSIETIANLQLIQINSDESETILETRPYMFNFVDETQDEQVIFDYVTPTVTDTTVLSFIGRVNNENGLSKDRGPVELTILPE